MSLTDDRVTSWEHRPGEQPNMTIDEFHEVNATLRTTRGWSRRSPSAA